MQTETVFKVAFSVWAVLFIMPVARANRKAKLEHGSRFAQSANEYAPLLWVRVIVGVPIWAFFDRLVGLRVLVSMGNGFGAAVGAMERCRSRRRRGRSHVVDHARAR